MGPVGFVSRTLNVLFICNSRNYLQLDKEGSAMVFGLKKFHKYLFGRTFSTVMDHKSLVSLFHEEKAIPDIASPRIVRWAVILRAYQNTMQYKQGRERFSRLPVPVTVAPDPEEQVLMLSAHRVAKWTKQDSVCTRVHEYPLRGWPQDECEPELGAYLIRKQELAVQDGCILWGAHVVIPPQGQEQVVTELHVAHPGISRMK